LRAPTANRLQETPLIEEDLMSNQAWASAKDSAPSRWKAALWAAVLAFTVVVSSGVVLLTARMVTDASTPAPQSQAASGRTASGQAGDLAIVGAGTAPSPSPTTGQQPTSSRLVVVPPRRVVDTRTTHSLRAGATVHVPLPGVPATSAAVLLEVSVLKAAGSGDVTLISADQETTALRVPRKGAQTSATVVVQLAAGGKLSARTQGGGHLVITLSGVLEPAVSSRAGRLVPVPDETALVLLPGRDGNRATINPAKLSLGGNPRAQVSALMLAFQADVGVHGGTVAVGSSWGHLDQQVYWAATAPPDRTRRGFLIVPLSSGPLRLYYHAGTTLTVRVVGVITSNRAPRASAGLAEAIDPTALPRVTLPAGGRADVDLPGAGNAKAVLVTTVLTPRGGRPRAVLGLLDVHAGTIRVNGPERAHVTVTPRLLIR
jgi:hypothetical protein